LNQGEQENLGGWSARSAPLIIKRDFDPVRLQEVHFRQIRRVDRNRGAIVMRKLMFCRVATFEGA